MNVNMVRMSQQDSTMANLRQFVMAQYRAAPRQAQNMAHQFFNAMDRDGNGSVDYREFKYFLVSEGFEYYAGRNLFMKLDGDGNRGLDFWEVMTLYYILKSGRPFCFRCDNFLWDLYSVCTSCRGGPFFFCNNCYQCHLQEHRFSVQPIMRGPSMQRSQTSNAMVQPMRGPSMQRSQTSNVNGMTMYASGGHPSQSSSNYYMVPAVSRSTSGKDKNSSLRTAYRAFEVALGVGNLAVGIASCSIM